MAIAADGCYLRLTPADLMGPGAEIRCPAGGRK